MKDNKIYNVYIGYDEKDKAAYEVLKFSIERISSVPVEIKPIKLSTVERMGLYNRKFSINEDGQRYDDIDKRPFSTDFSFTRFLVPHLNMYEGMALYMDADMYIRADIKELFDICNDPYYPLWCVHHKYEPKATIKMDNQLQEPYHRKNWSSLMMFNCAHPLNKPLTVEAVNTKSGRWLHGFEWLPDKEVDIGKIPEEWNWLDGHSPVKPKPKNVHFTTGGPWFSDWNPSRSEDSPYIIEWHNDREWINITGGKDVEDE